jgi:hypothetical protein
MVVGVPHTDLLVVDLEMDCTTPGLGLGPPF